MIKIGSSVLFTKRNKLDEFRIDHIASQIISLRERGIAVVFVISGAVACGSRFVNLGNSKISRKVAAGIGQVILTSTFHNIFKKRGLQVAQILLTKNDSNFQEMNRVIYWYVNAGYIPLINENDVVDLNSFKGNDFLGAKITISLGLNRFIMLSTINGSSFGVGGEKAKQQVIRFLKKRGIETNIVDGKVKNILLNLTYEN